MATFEDSCKAPANTYIDARFTTRLSDDALTTDYWKSLSGAFAHANGDGIGMNWDYDPLETPLIAITARQGTVGGVVEADIANINNNALNIGLNVDPLTGIGLIFEMGNVGFGGITARVMTRYDIAVAFADGTTQTLGAGDPTPGADQTIFSSYNNQPLKLRLTVSAPGGVQHVLCEAKSGAASSYTTIFDKDISVLDYVPASGCPSLNVYNFATGGKVTRFIATYTPTGTPLPTGATADILTVGDSNNEFNTPAGAGLGKQTLPVAVGEAIRAANNYAIVRAYGVAQSATTAQDWANAGGNNPRLLAHAAAVTVFHGIKAADIALGTNDAKDSVARTKTQYKADVLAIRAALVAAGITKFVLFGPAWVSPAAGDFSGANTLIAQYHTALQEIAAANADCVYVGDLFTFFATNNGATYLPDGIHYSLGTAGAPAARDIYVTGLTASVLSVYPSTPPAIPARPVVTITDAGADISISWPAVSGATSYTLKQGDVTLSTNATSPYLVSKSTIPANTNPVFSVFAVNGTVSSAPGTARAYSGGGGGGSSVIGSSAGAGIF